MIKDASTRGRPLLDRDHDVLLRMNKPTINQLDHIATKNKVKRNTAQEACMRASKHPMVEALIAQYCEEIERENQLYPEPMEATEPELTPEAAYANIDPLLKEEFKPEDLAAYLPEPSQEQSASPQETEVKACEPNLWTSMRETLTGRINPEHFETWLSSVRFLFVDDTNCMALSVPNTFFQEHLTETYKDLIEETLSEFVGTPHTVSFEVAPVEIQAPPAVEFVKPAKKPSSLQEVLAYANPQDIDALEAIEDRAYDKLLQRRMDEAEQRAARTGNQKRYAEELDILRGKRLKEEKRREEFRKQRRAIFAVCGIMANIRQPGTPQHQRQYEAPSAFATEGGATRKDRDALARALRGASKAPKAPS